MQAADLSLPVLCGQIIVGGFDGITLPNRFATALRRGLRGGAILFKRNVHDLASTHALCMALREVCPSELPPFVAVDQEGGRVARLRGWFPALPPMRLLGQTGDFYLATRVGKHLGRALAALGFNLDFAPVLDVDSNPNNPIIGDRSFATQPDLVAALAVAFGLGLEESGVLSCGKHFPGHGDTSVDSHVGLPIVHHPRERLDEIELIPFRAYAEAGLGTIMTAHVVVTSLDEKVPATLSSRVCTDLLRRDVGFRGVLFSDDLEMAAVAATYAIEDSAVQSIRAGCDALLVCSDEDFQDRAHEALVRECERDATFRARCVEAVDRALEARRKRPPRPVATAEEARGIVSDVDSLGLLNEIERRVQDAAR
jgi:beta-N-acetylhexosaminidase